MNEETKDKDCFFCTVNLKTKEVAKCIMCLHKNNPNTDKGPLIEEVTCRIFKDAYREMYGQKSEEKKLSMKEENKKECELCKLRKESNDFFIKAADKYNVSLEQMKYFIRDECNHSGAEYSNAIEELQHKERIIKENKT